MSYTRHYADPSASRAEIDARAVADVKSYLNPAAWGLVTDFAKKATSPRDVNELNMGFGVAGISGFPFHAFCRTYCLDAYVAWMNSDEGGQANPVGPDGFPIED